MNLYFLCFVLSFIIFLPQNTNIFWKFFIINNLLIICIFIYLSLLWTKFINPLKQNNVWTNGHLVLIFSLIYAYNVSQSHVYTINNTFTCPLESTRVVNESTCKSFWFCYSQVYGRRSATSLVSNINLQKSKLLDRNPDCVLNTVDFYYKTNLNESNKLRLYVTDLQTNSINNCSYTYQSCKNEYFRFVKNNVIVKFDSLLVCLQYLVILTLMFLL